MTKRRRKPLPPCGWQPHWERLLDGQGNLWAAVPNSCLVECPEGERYTRAWIEERVGALRPATEAKP